MNKLNILASIIEGETLCLIDDLLEDQTFKELFYKYAKTKNLDEASRLLTEYVNEELA